MFVLFWLLTVAQGGKDLLVALDDLHHKVSGLLSSLYQ